MKKFGSQIGIEENFLYKKLFFIHLELKNYKEAMNILVKLLKEFGRDKKLLRMYGEESEIDPKGGDIPMRQYKSMMINDQNDNESIKKYIYFMKISVDLNNKQTINDYIELWNFYLDVYMNDPDAYNELAQIYLMANEYDKAIFCLEELLLHSPDDYKIMNKLGDIYCSKNNSADAKIAIKYYSQSVLINPTPRAFFGIQNSANIIIQKEKKLDDKVKKLVDISKNELTKLYGETSFKDFDVNKIFRV
jgi:tetratricopeptide (TPR) repeat protein